MAPAAEWDVIDEYNSLKATLCVHLVSSEWFFFSFPLFFLFIFLPFFLDRKFSFQNSFHVACFCAHRLDWHPRVAFGSRKWKPEVKMKGDERILKWLSRNESRSFLRVKLWASHFSRLPDYAEISSNFPIFKGKSGRTDRQTVSWQTTFLIGFKAFLLLF